MLIPEIDYDSHPAYRDRAGTVPPERAARLCAAHASARDMVAKAFGGHLARPKAEDTPDGLAGGMARHGIAAFDLDPGRNDGLFKVLDQEAAEVRESGKAARQTTLDTTRPDGGAGRLGAACMELVRAFGLLDLAAAQLGTTDLFVKGSVRYSTPENQAYQRDTIPGHQDPATVGLHFDVPVNSIKLTVFLSDVDDLEAGAFGYIPGSHHRPADDVLDRTATHLVCSQDWVDPVADLMALPNRLRQRATFGGDVVPGSAMESEILASERVVTGPRGRCMLFDTLGAHRGGMVRRGARSVMQIGLFDKAWGMHPTRATP